MGNIISYLNEYGDKSFSEVPFGEADVLLLAQLSYLKFDGIVPTIAQRESGVTLREVDEKMDPDVVFADKWYEKENRELWEALLGSRRYEKMLCNNYRARTEEEEELQFGAVTFFPEGCAPVIAFRGTDDSVIGWKEDFNMAFTRPLPSQRMSAVYLNQAACRIDGPFLVCGHSKGGNLAVFASMWADAGVRRRIREVYSLDGPGFLPELLSEEGYREVRGRLRRILPASSVVGMLLQNEEQYEVVKSSAYGMMQHNAYTWQIEDGRLVRETDIEEKQKRMDKALNEWIFALSEEERELFVDTFFGLIGKTGATTVFEFARDWKNNLKICLWELRRIEPDTRRRIRQILKQLLEIYGSVMGKQEKKQT